MEAGYSNTPQIVKSGVTNEEYAVVSEHLDELPGVDTTTYWDRSYPENSTLRTLLEMYPLPTRVCPKIKYSITYQEAIVEMTKLGRAI